MAAPPVSVLIPAFNSEATIGAALASVRDQDVADLEVIVVEAGSDDATEELARECARHDPRIRVIGGLGRLSAPAARNAGLAAARGDIVVTLDSDDLMLPGRIRAQVAALRADPAVVAIGGPLLVVDSAGLTGVTQHLDPRNVPTRPARARYVMPFTCPCLTSSLTFRSDALRRIGGFHEDRPWADDYALLWSLMGIGDVALLPDYVGRYRRHSSQISSTRRPGQVLEVAATRRAIAEATVGRRVAWTSALAWSSCRVDDLARRRAKDDLVAYDRAYRARYPVDGDDAEWMAARLERVCDAIDRIARDSAEGLAPPGGVPVDLDQVGDESP